MPELYEKGYSSFLVRDAATWRFLFLMAQCLRGVVFSCKLLIAAFIKGADRNETGCSRNTV